jgi:glycerol-3-phosphate O-acyltransferase
MGAYFIRRSLRTALYRKVLGTYVLRATEAGVTQAVFPEGALSRTGSLGTPKLGILSYIAGGWVPGGRNVVFVPVALNYDRVVEDRILVAAERSGKRAFRASIPEAMRFALRYLHGRMTGRVGKFGVAAVTFGVPLSLADIARQEPDDLVEALADRLFSALRADMPVTTVPLALLALERLDRAANAADIAGEMAVICPKSSDKDIAAALDTLVMRRILRVDGGAYSVADHGLAAYYANSVRPLLSATAPHANGDPAS